MTEKEKKQKIVDRFLEELDELGYNEVTLVASDSSNRNKLITTMQTENSKDAMVLIAMQIKILAEETNDYSPDIAKAIAEHLEDAEKRFKEIMHEENKKNKKTIHIKVTESDE